MTYLNLHFRLLAYFDGKLSVEKRCPAYKKAELQKSIVFNSMPKRFARKYCFQFNASKVCTKVLFSIQRLKDLQESIVFNSTPAHLWVSSLAKCVLTAFRNGKFRHYLEFNCISISYMTITIIDVLQNTLQMLRTHKEILGFLSWQLWQPSGGMV